MPRRAAHPDFEMLEAGELLEQLKVADACSLCSGGASGTGYLRLWPHLHHTDGFFAAVWAKRPEKGETTRDARLGAPGSFTLSYPISGGAHRLRRLEMGLNALPCTELTRGVALQELQSVLLGAGLLKQGV